MNNVAIFVGRITKDLELRCTTSGKQVVEVNIAINNAKDDTTYVKVNCFGNTAEMVHKYCKKGDLIGTQTIVKNNVWTDKNELKHYDYTFIANKITFLQSKSKVAAEVEETVKPVEEQNDPYADFAQEVIITDDMLPF